MTTAYYCVFVAGLLPYVGTMLAKSSMKKVADNAHPRAWEAALTGWRQRANWAQLNGFEAFPFFAVGVIIAHLRGAEQELVDVIALAFVGARVLYLVAFLSDSGVLRSTVWSLGFALAIATYFTW